MGILGSFLPKNLFADFLETVECFCFEGQTQYDACGIELRTRIANETAMIEGKISPSTQRQREPHNFFARQQRT